MAALIGQLHRPNLNALCVVPGVVAAKHQKHTLEKNQGAPSRSLRETTGKLTRQIMIVAESS
jgi:hypothetical protein